jgi:hypothetical protein
VEKVSEMIVDDIVGLFPAELVGIRAASPDQEPEGVARHTLVYGQAKLCIQCSKPRRGIPFDSPMGALQPTREGAAFSAPATEF